MRKILFVVGLIFAILFSTTVLADYWNPLGYQLLRVVNITTGSEALTTNYTVDVVGLDTSNVSSYLGDCQALRVIYQNTTEINRVVHDCGLSNTSVEFKIQSAIPINTKNYDYTIRYGNLTSISPALENWNSVYWFADKHDSWNASLWTNITKDWGSDGWSDVTVNGSMYLVCHGTNILCGFETVEKDFTVPFSLEMGNTYWNPSFIIVRQLNATGNLWSSDFRGGLYAEGIGVNNWLWFSVDNDPAYGESCSYDISNPHDRVIKVYNSTDAEYWQDGSKQCSTSYNIPETQTWGVVYALGGHNSNPVQVTDYTIMRKLTNESGNPSVSFSDESVLSKHVIITINSTADTLTTVTDNETSSVVYSGYNKTIDLVLELNHVYLVSVTSDQTYPFSGSFDASSIDTFTASPESFMTPTGIIISDIGSGIGNFLSAIYLPLGNLILILGIIAGVVAIFMGIAYVIRGKLK